jgi:hypothetical protein
LLEANSSIEVRPLEGSLRFANFVRFLKKPKEYRRACRVHTIPKIVLTAYVTIPEIVPTPITLVKNIFLRVKYIFAPVLYDLYFFHPPVSLFIKFGTGGI